MNVASFWLTLIFKKLFTFKVTYSICNTEEAQISKFPIYCYKETKFKIDRESVIPIEDLTDILS